MRIYNRVVHAVEFWLQADGSVRLKVLQQTSALTINTDSFGHTTMSTSVRVMLLPSITPQSLQSLDQFLPCMSLPVARVSPWMAKRRNDSSKAVTSTGVDEPAPPSLVPLESVESLLVKRSLDCSLCGRRGTEAMPFPYLAQHSQRTRRLMAKYTVLNKASRTSSCTKLDTKEVKTGEKSRPVDRTVRSGYRSFKQVPQVANEALPLTPSGAKWSQAGAVANNYKLWGLTVVLWCGPEAVWIQVMLNKYERKDPNEQEDAKHRRGQCQKEAPESTHK
ncbi:hypothetical protein EYF80_011340 [Liparis tanakae]|uniref:Uncharacterized protein n=1 Tax=Liparis tanakae TaxID=230148 RepID=A0A4Z2IKE7_9TELE|nr:hypothetical protein EYF80_011340 [Liparis tanakae]